MNNVEYDVLFFVLVIAAVLLYTIVLFIGYRRAVNETKEEREEGHRVISSVKEFLEEVKTIIEKGEDEMTEVAKGTLKVEGAGLLIPTVKPKIKNSLTLTDLVTRKPTNENYTEVVELLAELARKTFEDYKFLIIKSPNEEQDYNFVQLVSKYEDDPYLHKLLFSKGIDYGLDMQELSKRFAKHAEAGNIIPLGEDVILLTDDGTGQSPTGVSPITSGMEGSDIAFILGFIQKKNFDEWHKNNFPQKDEE